MLTAFKSKNNIKISLSSWFSTQKEKVQDIISKAIDSFCFQFTYESDHEALSIDDFRKTLRSYLHMHWESLLEQIILNEERETIQLYRQFKNLGLRLPWFKEAQKSILESLTIFILEEGPWKKEECNQALKTVNDIILENICQFYSAPLKNENIFIEQEKKRITNVLENTLLVITESLKSSTDELKMTTGLVFSSSQETQNKATSMTSMSEQFSENVSAVSQATQQLSISIDEIADQLSKGTSMTRKSAEEAKQAEDVVRGLSKAANKIGEVVKIINEIANQTNLLALNATIEAARAGNAGKGFSVVASEVKNLAGQTAKATDEITQQIKAMQDATEEVVASIDRMTRTIKDINEGTMVISSAVEEQGVATQDIFRSIAQVASSSRVMVSTISELSSSANVACRSTQQTLNLTAKITDQSQYLKEAIQRVIDNVLKPHPL